MASLLSVIIPTCNRNELLSRCLNKLKPSLQSVETDMYEIIVTDDSKQGSSKKFIEIRYPGVKWIEGPKKGPAANRNNGAKYAKNNWLIFIDDDCVPDYKLISAYAKAITDYEKIKVFEGFVGVDREQRNFLEESPINTTGGYLWSCNFMIEKNLFNNVLKGFDEGYPFASMEDVDMHYRLKKINEPVQFLSGACVIHPWRVQLKPFKIGKQRFLSLIYFLNKFPEKKKDYNAVYFFKSFFFTITGILKNSVRFRFRGFFQRCIVGFLQLYYALRISKIN